VNALGPGAMDALQLGQITADVRDLIQDADIAVTAIIHTPGSGGSLDPASGIVAATGTDDSVTGYLADLNLREVMADPRYQRGDQLLVVLVSDLSVNPSTATAFRVGDDRYDVISVDRDALGVAYHLVGRRTT